MQAPTTERIGNEIVVRLRTIAQLFHSLDPSPFRDRDLDQSAAQFIIESAMELPSDVEPKLIICVPASERHRTTEVPQAVRHYFQVLKESEQSELRELVRHGRKALFIGVILVIIVETVIETLRGLVAERDTIAAGVLESLTIVAWVILWRPLEILLYDRLPHKSRVRLYDRLASMDVIVQPVHDPQVIESGI